jgi:hypothetical protein
MDKSSWFLVGLLIGGLFGIAVMGLLIETLLAL